MPFDNPLFWRAAGFSGFAIAFVCVSAWWLYLSRLKAAVGPVAAPSPKLAGWLAALLGVSAAQLTIGALWDGSMHIQTGEVPGGADFLWPPHIMIYSAFGLAFLVAIVTIALVAAPGWRKRELDPRLWVRRNPYLGAVALASTYALLSIPGDAIWHELFGFDLTAWSPPHVLLAAMMAAVIVSAVALLARARAHMRSPGRADAGMIALLSLMLNVVYVIGVVEWEFAGAGEGSRLVQTNPHWVYPLVGGLLAFFALALAKRLTAFRWAATATFLAFYLFRAAITLGLGLTGNVTPTLPLAFFIGAILMDALPWQRIRSLPLRDLATAAAYTLGGLLLALPLLAGRADLRAPDYLWTVLVMLLASAALLPLVRRAGDRLLPDAR